MPRFKTAAAVLMLALTSCTGPEPIQQQDDQPIDPDSHRQWQVVEIEDYRCVVFTRAYNDAGAGLWCERLETE